MDRTLLRLLAATLLAAGLALPATADDALRAQAIKLNTITGNTAMATRLREMAKDEAGTKKLIAEAVKMAKDEKPTPLNYNSCFLLAKAAQVVEDYESALVFYRVCTEEATKLGSESKLVAVYNGRINLHIANKKYDTAIQACQDFLDLESNDIDSEINLEKPFVLEKKILATARKGSIDDALKMAEDLIEKDRGGFYFVRLKADVLREGERYADAADALLETIELLKKGKRLPDAQRDAFISQMRYQLSGVYVDLKEIDKGAEQLQILMKEDPENPTYYNDLGFIWADHDKNIDESEKLIRKALEKDREERKKEKLTGDEDVDNPAYLDSLGWVLFKKKDYKEARKHLEAATKLEGGKHIEIYDHLADTLMALGEKAEAVKVWKDALKLKDISKRDAGRRKKVEEKLAAAEKK